MYSGLLRRHRDLQRRRSGRDTRCKERPWGDRPLVLLLGNHHHTRCDSPHIPCSYFGGEVCLTLTMLQDHGKELHGLKALAVFMTGAIFATTVSFCRAHPSPLTVRSRFEPANLV